MARWRFLVTSSGGWTKTSTATLVSEPELVETLKGPEFYYRVDLPGD
jgi:hypothetical protein